MYTQHIQCLPDEHIIIERVPADFDLRRDTIPANCAVIAALNSMLQPVPYILDFSGMCGDCNSKENVLGQVTRGAAPAYTHRNIKVLCVVTGHSTINVGALVLAQAAYHGIDACVFPTLDEALAYARGVAPALMPSLM